MTAANCAESNDFEYSPYRLHHSLHDERERVVLARPDRGNHQSTRHAQAKNMTGSSFEEARTAKFSLRSLILLTTIAAMVAALVSLQRHNRQLAQRNAQLRDENLRLRNELGELSVEDPTQLHAIRTSNGEGLQWEWRIWIPEGHVYLLRGSGGMVPEEGWPQEGGTIYLRDSGEQVIRYRIVKDPRNDKWYGSLSTRSGSVGKDLQEWVDWGSTSSRTSGVGSVSRAFPNAEDGIIELCRHRVTQRDSSNKIEENAAGFVIWLERQK